MNVAGGQKAMAAGENFICTNVSGQNITSDVYVVCSYGMHWPLSAKIHGQWYVNGTKYRRPTTNKHAGQYYPHFVPAGSIKTVTVAELQALISAGILRK